MFAQGVTGLSARILTKKRENSLQKTEHKFIISRFKSPAFLLRWSLDSRIHQI